MGNPEVILSGIKIDKTVGRHVAVHINTSLSSMPQVDMQKYQLSQLSVSWIKI